MHLHPCMARIDLRLFAVVLDDQLIVTVGLDVKASLTRESDHLHRCGVRNAVVEHHTSIEVTDLGALVADDRALEAQALHPWHGAWERATGAGDHRHARGEHAVHGLDVARVELELQAEYRPVEIEREQPI